MTFFVGTYARPGWLTFGRLTVQREAITLEGWPQGRRMIAHRARRVSLVRARYAPPWSRWGLVLHDGPHRCGVKVKGSHVERLRVSLEWAGYEVQEERTRFWRFPWASLD